MRFNAEVAIYRRVSSGADSEGQVTFAWTAVATGVRARVQGAGAGGVVQEPSGRIATATHWLLLPTGTDLQADDGVRVTALTSGGPTAILGERLMVGRAFDWGRGGVQAEADTTHEDFG